jgi:hypothetical protein
MSHRRYFVRKNLTHDNADYLVHVPARPCTIKVSENPDEPDVIQMTAEQEAQLVQSNVLELIPPDEAAPEKVETPQANKEEMLKLEAEAKKNERLTDQMPDAETVQRFIDQRKLPITCAEAMRDISNTGVFASWKKQLVRDHAPGAEAAADPKAPNRDNVAAYLEKKRAEGKPLDVSLEVALVSAKRAGKMWKTVLCNSYKSKAAK